MLILVRLVVHTRTEKITKYLLVKRTLEGTNLTNQVQTYYCTLLALSLHACAPDKSPRSNRPGVSKFGIIIFTWV